jgi:hypothetical protein
MTGWKLSALFTALGLVWLGVEVYRQSWLWAAIATLLITLGTSDLILRASGAEMDE